MNSPESLDPEPHHLSDPVGGSEDISDVAHRGHDIHLLSFIAVMALIQAVNLLLTQRLNFSFPIGNGFGEIVSIVSRIANAFFLVMLILAIITLVIARTKTPRFASVMIVTYLSVASINILLNILEMIFTHRLNSVSQSGLIGDLCLTFLSITLIFSLWYEVADTLLPGGAIDFPENTQHPDSPPMWFDYLILAFFANSTFGPTTEAIRSRIGRAIMMVQVSLALIVLIVLVAKIIKA